MRKKMKWMIAHDKDEDEEEMDEVIPFLKQTE